MIYRCAYCEMWVDDDFHPAVYFDDITPVCPDCVEKLEELEDEQ